MSEPVCIHHKSYQKGKRIIPQSAQYCGATAVIGPLEKRDIYVVSVLLVGLKKEALNKFTIKSD